MDPRPIVLEGRHVRIEPLDPEHAADLFAAGRVEEDWLYLPRPSLCSLEDALMFITQALEAARGASEIPFAIVALDGGRTVGSTRYLDIRRAHRGLEIGWTWISRAYQRTAVNTECKRLLFGHAFEDLGALRVQLKTDARNLRSQRAIERLGAVREGVLRKHWIVQAGFVRDSVIYSVTVDEWPDVRARLDRSLAAR